MKKGTSGKECQEVFALFADLVSFLITTLEKIKFYTYLLQNI